MKKKNIFIFILYFFVFSNLVKAQAGSIKTKADSCFFLISAIKSISGSNIESEFFDLYLKQNMGKYFFGFGSIDIALSNPSSTNIDSTSGKKLTEAMYSLNYSIKKLNHTQFYVGLKFKIFDGVPYYGIHFGGIEVDGKLYTSFLTIGFLRRFFKIEPELNSGLATKEHVNNIFISMAIHSKEIPFLKDLRIKGGLLIPTRIFNKTNPTEQDIKIRVVIEIPIGEIVTF